MLLSIIYIVIFLMAMFALLRYDIQMFQGNSYRYKRYLRWWRGGKMLSHGRWLLLFTFGASQNIWLQIVAILVMLCFSYREFTTKYKTPIVYTPRVKRLFSASFVVTILTVMISIILGGIKVTLVLISIMLLLSNFIMLVANFINTPIERSISRWYYNDAKKIITSHSDLIVIGITGSYGKTSTKNYLHRVLSERYNVLITPGNFNTLLGVVRTIRENLRPYHQIFIVEMGAKQEGDIKEICDLVKPKIGLLSSVGVAHLETFGSIENIQKTKFELINSLPKDGVAILNFDSEKIAQYDKITSQCKVVSYGVNSNDVDLHATEVNYSNSGLSFKLKLESCDKEATFNSHLLGEGNILNLTAAIAVGDMLRVEVKKMQTAIQQLKSVEHRLSMSRNNGLTILDDAYNSNPTGARMALAVLRTFSRNEGAKRIVITPGFVEMGAMQYEANRELGAEVAKSCDYAVVVNITNREAILAGLNDQNFEQERIYLANNLADAHNHLSSRLKIGDIILYENDLPDTFV